MRIFYVGDDKADNLDLRFDTLPVKSRFTALQKMPGFSTKLSSNLAKPQSVLDIDQEYTLLVHTGVSESERNLTLWFLEVGDAIHEGRSLESLTRVLYVPDPLGDWRYKVVCLPSAISQCYGYKGHWVLKTRFTVFDWSQVIDGDTE